MQTKNYTDEEFRAAINQPSPHELGVIALSLFQRFVIAVEKIAKQGEPVTMLGQPRTGV